MKISTITSSLTAVFFLILPIYAQWNLLPGFQGQQLLSMIEKDTCIFVGTDFQGMYRSTDSGNQWLQINSGLTQHTIKAICVKGTDLFVGTSSGVFRSSNNGNTWTNSGLTNISVEDILTDGIYIFAGTSEGVFRSIDNGDTWLEKNNGLTNTGVHALFFHEARLFAGTWYDSEGISVSTDLGETWNLSNTGLTAFDLNTFASVGTDIFAGTNTEGVFRSTDNGTVWTKCDSGLTNGTTAKLHANGENIFVSTQGGGVYLSTNRGVSWSSISAGIPNPYIGPVISVGSYFYAGTFGDGIYRRQLGTMPIAYSDTASITIISGWNLVSIPFVPYLSSPDSLLTNNQSVYGFNNSTKTYSIPGDITYGNGYWSYYFQSDTTLIFGMDRDSVILDVPQAGWVLFGSRSSTVSISGLTSSPTGSILGNIYRFNNSLGSYQAAAQIIPGEGYWIYVTQPCRLKLQ